MATKKQRRRRQKGRRHDYEFVYVDDEGQEIEVAGPEAKPREERKQTTGVKPTPGAKKANAKPAGRADRVVDPPSWDRTLKRAAIFVPIMLIFLAFGVLDHRRDILGKLALTAVYTALFVPFMYLMDRAMYRMYLRRTGNLPERAPRRR